MKILSLWAGLALMAFAVSAAAHAHLQMSSPADGSVITTTPATLTLNFSEPARLTALTIQKGDEPKQSIKAVPTTAAQQIFVPLPPLTPGRYTVSFRNLSSDGHVMSGSLHFTLEPQPARH